MISCCVVLFRRCSSARVFGISKSLLSSCPLLISTELLKATNSTELREFTRSYLRICWIEDRYLHCYVSKSE